MKNHQLFHLGIKAVIVNRKKEILVLQKNKKIFAIPGKAFLDLPGGRLKKGSTVKKTLLREIKEETGLGKDDISTEKVLGFTLAHNKNPTNVKDVNLILMVYLCKLKGNGKIMLNYEHVNYKWTKISEAKKLLAHKYPKDFIKILDNIT